MTSICVVTMNRGDTLRQTVLAIRGLAIEPYEIIIVDNGSTDDATRILLDELESSCTIIRNETNLGLSVATNQGLAAGKYDVLIHMDDDCLIRTHGWNQIMASYFDIPEVGMVAPAQGRDAIRHPRYQELRWALGMCWAIRKDLFDDIGGYDPQLYHQNECDMALRVRMAGYHLAGIPDFVPLHNDPGGPRSERSLAAEHIGCVQFRDKWASYFRGRDWNYGTPPIYLMQHWPPDQEFFRRFALQEGLNLNPPPDEIPSSHADREGWVKLDHLAGEQKVYLQGEGYLIYRDIRNDYCHWEHVNNPNGYVYDRELAIERWFNLTGERYEGYRWPHNPLRPY